MKKFFKNMILFFFLALVAGEILVRVLHTMPEIPKRDIDTNGIQKYIPNQEGYWKGGKHKWNINSRGWPGILPKSYDSLFLVIGDSFIESFMNPNECHQAIKLKELLPNYNFMEASRSGVSFIESMEIAKQLQSLTPQGYLIYVHDNDFYESITEIKRMSDITQYSINENHIKPGVMKSPGFKKILYNWKLMHYLYNRFNPANNKKPKKNKTVKKAIQNRINLVKELIDFTKNNYSTTNKTLIFQPNANYEIIKLCKEAGFKVIELNSSNDKRWSFENDKHWTCYGHERVALQVAKHLKLLNL